MVQRDQQLRVDLLAAGQRAIEVHGAHDAADVGHRHAGQRLHQVLCAIGRLRRVEHTVVHDAVDGHGGVVAGDDRLLGDVEHDLLHVHLVPDLLHERHHEIQARVQQPGKGAEPLDRPDLALRHGANAKADGDDDDDRQHYQDD